MTSVLAPDPLGPTVCVGEILVEIVATTVGDGFLEAQPLVGPFASGAPAIFISQCGRLGGKAAMVGAVGDDDFGRVNTDRLKRDGVDVSTISIDPDYPTGSAFVRYRKDGSRDFVYNIATSAAARFGWSQDGRRSHPSERASSRDGFRSVGPQRARGDRQGGRHRQGAGRNPLGGSEHSQGIEAG